MDIAYWVSRERQCDMMNWLDREIKKAMKYRERIVKENERKMAKQQVVKSKILSKLPKCDFEPCGVCGNIPTLEVELSNTQYYLYVRCKKCDWDNGCHLNDYDIGDIPKEPLMPNPDYTWMDHWHTVNEWAKDEYEKFNSNDWKYKCCVCGEKRRGYDIDSFAVLNGKYYCKECLPKCLYVQHHRESNNVYYRTFADVLKVYGGTINDYVRKCE